MKTNPREPERLPAKLEAVLARLCAKLGPITKTKAVKLPYLVDVVAEAHLGRRVTEGTHQTWDLGVVTREAYRYFTHCDTGSRFLVQTHRYSESGQCIQAGSADATDLDSQEIQIVDEVARSYGTLDATSLGQLTKAMNTDLDPESWGSNHRARTDMDAYSRMSASWQHLNESLANLDLKDKKLWGESIKDPEEYLRRALNGS